MRIVVIGATGNLGTALLCQAVNHPDITSVVGIARRTPDIHAHPYSECEWELLDITRPAQRPRLSETLRGADAVIHVAWLVQPNKNRDLLRKVNVDGTAAVIDAVVEAGVPHLLVASSVGVYSPSPGEEPRDESWPREGIPTSHYSVDKVAQERALDSAKHAHPHLKITRIRPALIFQADAASEILRYFLTPRLPISALGALPTLPLPAGLRLQAVHAEDVAHAFILATTLGADGAYNIAADDVVSTQQIAKTVSNAVPLPVPTGLARLGVRLGHRMGLIGADAGWVDLAQQAPVMDSSRARQALGWRPTYTALEAFTELVQAMAGGQGASSVPLRSEQTDDAEQPPPPDMPRLPEQHVPDDHINADLLSVYLSDHLAGALAGKNRIHRMEQDFADTAVFPLLSELSTSISAERVFLVHLTKALGLQRPRIPDVLTWAGERLGRFKPNGRAVTRSPLTLLLETELMSSAVLGKLHGWQSLHDLAEHLGVEPGTFRPLIDAADQQLALLEQVHQFARQHAFAWPPPHVDQIDMDPSPTGKRG